MKYNFYGQRKKIIGKHYHRRRWVSVKYLASDVADPKMNRIREHFEPVLWWKRPFPYRSEESAINKHSIIIKAIIFRPINWKM